MPFGIRIQDRSDYLFYLALALLPVDGTVIGFYMPFWTPISPWLFLLYAIANWRIVKVLGTPGARHNGSAFPTSFILFPLVLIALSVFGWITTAFHPVQALNSLLAVISATACLLSLHIAIREKHLPWRPMVNILLAVYWLAFAVGVLQRVAVSLDIACIREYFAHLMSREYITAGSKWGGNRPQFLFAEPSYIGMHLFGVLLPLHWMLRRKAPDLAYNLAALIITFATGAVLMGAGTRIILDSLVAMAMVIAVATAWRQTKSRRRGLLQLLGVAVLSVVAFAVNSRLSSIAENGAEGDGSFFARIWQSLGVLCGLAKHPVHLLFGFGAGNLSDATHLGSETAVHALQALGFSANNVFKAEQWYANVTPANMFTMSAYTSFLGEFGLIGFAVLISLIISHVTDAHAWSKTTVCWFLLVVYLYTQFEGYAFYALPLFVWGTYIQTGINTNIVTVTNDQGLSADSESPKAH
ncbi:hypothetical protein JS532_06230 [Bifidobacterium callimiconis]|uniref:hypothetical protein n=1 Tax=Bifidobacterium callimiconis TaxID=2306973 RepID=UPI001BDCDED2|nr:hypothetical protein [Bifidobacterium callimiconis]MBT1177163.1 hypothetical protein [Bifidobacterium callimiconis]